MKISTNEAISAIYYALWQSGYEYAALERDEGHMVVLMQFAEDAPHPFFTQTRQNSCAAYAFWPRAALLETAAFHLDVENARYADFDGLQQKIMAMPNRTKEERDDAFWAWLAEFPAALHAVLESTGFRRYQSWLEKWKMAQNEHYRVELDKIEHCLAVCRERYDSPLKEVVLLIDPIKCVYSADYHVVGERFVFSSGRFRPESVIHEYLHHVVRPVVQRYAAEIPVQEYPGLDESYYAAGAIYAFEEQVVRQLTVLAMTDELPQDLDEYVQRLLR